MNELFLAEARRRLTAIFQMFKQGQDVAPALQYRTEGFLDAGVFLSLVEEQQLSVLIAELQREIFDCPDQRIQAGTVLIPTLMKRAPVMP